METKQLIEEASKPISEKDFGGPSVEEFFGETAIKTADPVELVVSPLELLKLTYGDHTLSTMQPFEVMVRGEVAANFMRHFNIKHKKS